jgi:small subunit ribosomal protein S17
MENTVVVAVRTSRRHPLYKKTIRRVRKFMAHDESGETRLGDVVRIVEIAPVSRHKRWGVIEVLEKAELPDVAPESIDLEIIGEVKAEEPEEDVTEPSAEETPPAETPEPEVEAVDEAPVAEEEPAVEELEETAEEAVAENEPAPEVEADIGDPEEASDEAVSEEEAK